MDRSVLMKGLIVTTNELKHGNGRRPEVVRDGGLKGDGVFMFATNETTVSVMGEEGDDEKVEEEDEKGKRKITEDLPSSSTDVEIPAPSPVKRRSTLMGSGTSNVSTAVPILGVGKGTTASICGIFFPQFDFIIDESNADEIASSSPSILETLGVKNWSDLLLKESKPSEYR